MNKLQWIFVGLVLGFSGFGKLFAAAPDDLLASYHFVGSTALAGNTNAARLNKIAALPETLRLRDDVLQKLARASVKFFGSQPGTANQAALLKPLFDDLLKSDSRAELRGKPNAGLEFYLAIQLDDVRSKIWETNLFQAAKVVKPQAVKLDESAGWQANVNGGANYLKFVRAGTWTFVMLAAEQSPAQSAFVKRIKKETRSGTETNWLEADIDWPRLQPWVSLDALPFKPARTEIKIVGRGGENLRTTMRVIYPEKIDWKSDPWIIPTNSIRDPLISFTAGQKLTPFFKTSKAVQQLSFNPLTSQMYFWALSQMPFQSYAAVSARDVTNAMKALVPQMTNAFNDSLKRRGGGALVVTTNRTDLIWQGLQLIVPFLRPIKEKNGNEFLQAGLFPMAPNTNLPPAELFGQILGKNDLVFYDWEVTQPRLGQWQMLSQILPFFSKELFVGTNAAMQPRYVAAKVPERRWLTAISPMLGNTVTEVTFKAPNELNVVRNSHIGLNSLELVLLSHWLAHPNFPSVNPFATVDAGRLSAPAINVPSKP